MKLITLLSICGLTLTSYAQAFQAQGGGTKISYSQPKYYSGSKSNAGTITLEKPVTIKYRYESYLYVKSNAPGTSFGYAFELFNPEEPVKTFTLPAGVYAYEGSLSHEYVFLNLGEMVIPDKETQKALDQRASLYKSRYKKAGGWAPHKKATPTLIASFPEVTLQYQDAQHFDFFDENRFCQSGTTVMCTDKNTVTKTNYTLIHASEKSKILGKVVEDLNARCARRCISPMASAD